MKYFVHISTVITWALCSSFAAATWQVGAFTGAEFDESANETSPIVLPWLAYQSDHWQVNPLNIAFQKPVGPAKWRVGLAMDYGASEESWTEVFAAKAGVEVFAGPVRFDNSAQVTITQLSNWTSRHTVSTMLPLAPYLLFGIESGISLNQKKSLPEPQSSWVNGVQLMSGFNSWRFMALGSWNKNLSDSNDKLTGMLSVVYEW